MVCRKKALLEYVPRLCLDELYNDGGLVFLLPALSVQPLSLEVDPQTIGLLLMGSLLLLLYVLAPSIIFAIVPYALVEDDLDPLQAIFASINFFRYNKFDVLILWLVVVAFSISMQMVAAFSRRRM